jgi:hypothetical protein
VNAGALAFAHTRVRAARGRLVDAKTGPFAWRALMEQLAADYECILRSTPGDREPFLALRARHENENLKLALRAVIRGHPEARWTPCWRPIGELKLEDFRHARSIADLPLPEDLPRELEAAERALDRRVSQRIAAAAVRSEPDLGAILSAVAGEERMVRSPETRRLCARAFLRGPFSRAPAAALLLLEEDVMAQALARAEAA